MLTPYPWRPIGLHPTVIVVGIIIITGITAIIWRMVIEWITVMVVGGGSAAPVGATTPIWLLIARILRLGILMFGLLDVQYQAIPSI